MARQRMIRPEIWESRQVDSLSDFEFRVYVGLISHADDNGRLSANPNSLAAKIFPLRGETSLPGQIQEAILKMEAHRDSKDNTPLVGLYQHGDEAFLFHPKWDKYQRIPKERRAKSKLPAPPLNGRSSYREARGRVTAFGYKLPEDTDELASTASGVPSGMPSGVPSGVSSGVPSGVPSGVSSGIPSGIHK